MKSFIYLLSILFQDFVTAFNHNPATPLTKSNKFHLLSLGLELLQLHQDGKFLGVRDGDSNFSAPVRFLVESNSVVVFSASKENGNHFPVLPVM
jgi:hypothetical protein